METSTLVTIMIIGVVAGVFSGFVGLGGGMIVVPALVFFLGFSQHSAQGTSLAMMLPPIGILAVYNYHRAGHLDIKVALILAASFIIGSYFGSKYAIALPADTVKKVFGVVIILIGIKFLLGK